MWEEFYGRVSLSQFADSGDVDRMVNITASPVVYGVTVPYGAPENDMAVAFLELLLGPDGQQVFSEMGQPPLVPALSNNNASLPQSLIPYCVEG